MDLFEQIKDLLANVLGLGHRKDALTEGSALIGALPELDSMAVIHLITALEDHFGITVHDEEISAGTFETVGTLMHFVQGKLGG